MPDNFTYQGGDAVTQSLNRLLAKLLVNPNGNVPRWVFLCHFTQLMPDDFIHKRKSFATQQVKVHLS